MKKETAKKVGQTKSASAERGGHKVTTAKGGTNRGRGRGRSTNKSEDQLEFGNNGWLSCNLVENCSHFAKIFSFKLTDNDVDLSTKDFIEVEVKRGRGRGRGRGSTRGRGRGSEPGREVEGSASTNETGNQEEDKFNMSGSNDELNRTHSRDSKFYSC